MFVVVVETDSRESAETLERSIQALSPIVPSTRVTVAEVEEQPVLLPVGLMAALRA